MQSVDPFTLPAVSIYALREMCQTYHGIWRKTKLTAHHLEEAIAKALEYYEPYRGKILWQANSHTAKADIRLTTSPPIDLSIKSGTRGKGKYREYIQVSGHRLTSAEGNLHNITQLLRTLVSDVVLCFVHDESRRLYECLYLDASIFRYPDEAKGWEPRMGEKRGRVEEYIYTSPEGFIAAIRPPLSWQIWWTIPRTLARQGPHIEYGHA